MAATGRSGATTTPVGQVQRGEERRGARLRVERRGHHVPQRLPELRPPRRRARRLDVDGEHQQPDGGGDALGEPVAHDDRRGSPASAAANSACAGGQVVRRPGAVMRRAGRDGLQAAALAAPARLAGRIDGDVPDLAGRAVRPAAQPAVEHQPGGQAGADAEVGQVAGGASSWRAERRDVDVVLQHHLVTEVPLSRSRRGSGSPPTPRLTACRTAPLDHVDQARYADADRPDGRDAGRPRAAGRRRWPAVATTPRRRARSARGPGEHRAVVGRPRPRASWWRRRPARTAVIAGPPRPVSTSATAARRRPGGAAGRRSRGRLERRAGPASRTRPPRPGRPRERSVAATAGCRWASRTCTTTAPGAAAGRRARPRHRAGQAPRHLRRRRWSAWCRPGPRTAPARSGRSPSTVSAARAPAQLAGGVEPAGAGAGRSRSAAAPAPRLGQPLLGQPAVGDGGDDGGLHRAHQRGRRVGAQAQQVGARDQRRHRRLRDPASADAPAMSRASVTIGPVVAEPLAQQRRARSG